MGPVINKGYIFTFVPGEKKINAVYELKLFKSSTINAQAQYNEKKTQE